MRVPPMIGFNQFCVQNNPKTKKANGNTVSKIPYPEPKDSVSFTSTAQYLKKYATLPDDIKAILTPKDAIDMFKDMELVANGVVAREKVGQGNMSKVYKTPWLQNYYFVILRDNDIDEQTIYSKINLGDSVWQDRDDSRIQLLQGAL